jgi:hypothetical protein
MITSLLMWHLPLFASWTGPLVTIPNSTPAIATAAMMPTAHSALTDHAPLITTAWGGLDYRVWGYHGDVLTH